MDLGADLPDPVQALAERLKLGGSPDLELLARAKACAQLFDDDPLTRLLSLGRLRKAAAEALHSEGLWEIVLPILRQQKELF